MRRLFVIALLVVGFGLYAPTAVARAQEAPTTTVPCVMEASAVTRGVAVFTIGPADCNVPLGPVSLSSYNLPGGFAKPWAEQQLHAHAPNNGGYYGAGTHTLWVSLEGLCNWQSDLYRGTGQDFAPHIHYLEGVRVGWDVSEGNDCTPVDGGDPIPVVSTDTQAAPPATSPQLVPLPANAGHGVFDPAPLTGAFSLAPSTFVGEVTVRSHDASAAPWGAAWPWSTAALVLLAIGGVAGYAYIHRRSAHVK